MGDSGAVRGSATLLTGYLNMWMGEGGGGWKKVMGGMVMDGIMST